MDNGMSLSDIAAVTRDNDGWGNGGAWWIIILFLFAFMGNGWGMNSQHRSIRAQLSSMAPKRAVAYILSFELPQDEAYCLIECDVRGKSRVEVAETLHVSPEYVKTRRRRAYSKIADGIKNA